MFLVTLSLKIVPAQGGPRPGSSSAEPQHGPLSGVLCPHVESALGRLVLDNSGVLWTSNSLTFTCQLYSKIMGCVCYHLICSGINRKGYNNCFELWNCLAPGRLEEIPVVLDTEKSLQICWLTRSGWAFPVTGVHIHAVIYVPDIINTWSKTALWDLQEMPFQHCEGAWTVAWFLSEKYSLVRLAWLVQN